MDPLVDLRVEEIDEILVGHLDGEIESSNVDDLRAALAGRLRNDTSGLVLDLTPTSYIDSAGIELLFDLARRLRTHRQRLRLVVPAEAPMRRVLELCDIERIAPISVTLEDALAALRGGG